MAKPFKDNRKPMYNSEAGSFTRPVERGVHVITHSDLLYLREELEECAQDEPLYINLDVEYWTAQISDEFTLFLSERDFKFILGAIRPKGYEVISVGTACEYRKEPRIIKRIRFQRFVR